MGSPDDPPSRRDRLRESTLREIKERARAKLLAEGPSGISLRAIARDMGMTAPALYRYFASHEALLTQIIADLYDELADDLEATRQAAGADTAAQVLAVSRRFRRWALDHGPEFGLLFGAPLPGYAVPHEGTVHEAGERFAQVWVTTFVLMWQQRPFPLPPADAAPESYISQIGTYAEALGGALPTGAVRVFLECWARLYGQICLEAFGHLHFALTDPEAMFEAMLLELGDRLGLPYTPPAASAG